MKGALPGYDVDIYPDNIIYARLIMDTDTRRVGGASSLLLVALNCCLVLLTLASLLQK
jgi:hypothetical protein